VKTWKLEMLIVSIILIAVNYFTHKLYTIELLAALAVLMTFGHAQIADRLAEQEALRTIPVVDCYRKMWYYFIGKEIFWFLYFFLNHSYSALIGVFVFIAYPFWRKLYRKINRHG
jgi:hypothetical protein